MAVITIWMMEMAFNSRLLYTILRYSFVEVLGISPSKPGSGAVRKWCQITFGMPDS